MKNFNLYKLIWISLGVIVLIGFILSIVFFARQSSQDIRFKKREIVAPEYIRGKVPGEITSQQSIPNLSENNMSVPTTDPNLIQSDAPLSGNAIKIPDKPAVPPNEEDIININILEGKLSIHQTTVKKGGPVIMRILSQDKDYYFYINGIGIVETIKANKSLTISFRAPIKQSELKYWIEYTNIKGETDKGKLNVN